jgi:hypothetical protein
MKTGPIATRSEHRNLETGARQLHKKTLILTAIKDDLAAGLPDEELLEKYEISPVGLQALFDKLLKAIASGSSHVELESR